MGSGALYRPFLAIDGESIDDPRTGEHKYILLETSTDARLVNLKGIGTIEALEFLCKLKRENKHAILVGFWFGYDVNMILRDVPWNVLETLWKRGSAHWKGWRLDWTPNKHFGASSLYGDGKFRVYDVHGFFQGSFVKALKAWGVGDEALLTFIEGMKGERGKFTKRMLPRMQEYAHAECVYLADLCEALRRAFNQAGFQPVGWYGAGAAAAGLMQNQGVKRYIARDDELPPNVLDAHVRAYFGGRVELLLQGEHKRAYSHDLASAYPAALTTLPTARGDWRKVRKPRPGQILNTNSVHYVEWSVPATSPIMPFPHRTKGNIYYPTHGKGFYHAVEINAARVLHPSGIHVGAGFRLTPDSAQTLPFTFVPVLYEARREAKRLGEAREKAYKLALNSLYGKLAQRQGWRDSPPPYRCTYWAGRITAWTRAQLLLKASENPSSIISFATDGILATEQLSFDNTGDLGSWESEGWSDVLAVQPGVYFGTNDETGKPIFKSRGWNTKEIDLDKLRYAWRTLGPYATITVPAQRFVGLGMALHRNDKTTWRTWPNTERELRFSPSRKLPDPAYKPTKRGDGVHRLLHNSGPTFNTVSEPFKAAEKPPPIDTPERED